MNIKHKIYCFNNSVGKTDWNHVLAVADDGHCLAGHICSHEYYFKHDIGITSNWQHDKYNKHFGEGNWELVWLDEVAPGKYPELDAAMALNQQLAEDAAKLKAAKEVPSGDSK